MLTPIYNRQPTNEVIINNMSDFPSPITGKIFLAADTKYIINNKIFSPYEFGIPDNTNNCITCNTLGANYLAYVGIGTMFTGSSVGILDLSGAVFISPYGRLFDITFASSSSFLIVVKTVFQDIANLGNFTNGNPFIFICNFINIGEGFKFHNCVTNAQNICNWYSFKPWYKLEYDTQTANFTMNPPSPFTITGGGSGNTGKLQYQIDNGTTGYLYLSDTTGAFTVGETITDGIGGSAKVTTSLKRLRCFEWTGTTLNSQVNNSFFLIGDNNSVFNIDPTHVVSSGVLSANVFTKTGANALVFDTGSVDQTGIFWKATGNVGLSDSTITAQFGLQNNSTATDIAEVSVPILVNGTYVFTNLERIIQTGSTQRVRYSGIEDKKIKVFASLSLRPSTGVSIKLGAYIGYNEPENYAVTFTNATEIVNRNNHGLANGTSIQFTTDGTLPATIRTDQFYFVINKTTNNFQISNTLGGVAHTFTTDGTGNNYYSLGQIIESGEINTTASSSNPNSVSVIASIPARTGTRIGVYVDNHDTTSDIVVETLNVII